MVERLANLITRVNLYIRSFDTGSKFKHAGINTPPNEEGGPNKLPVEQASSNIIG